MSKSIEQQAAEVLHERMSRFVVPEDNSQSCAAALSRAGLLVSPRDALCRKLAEACLAEYGFRADHGPVVCDAFNAILAYDREHAPKPRYCVNERMHPTSTCTHVVAVAGEASWRYSGTLAECTAVAAALNALAEKEAGR